MSLNLVHIGRNAGYAKTFVWKIFEDSGLHIYECRYPVVLTSAVQQYCITEELMAGPFLFIFYSYSYWQKSATINCSTLKFKEHGVQGVSST